MNVLVDTHILLWAAAQPSRLPAAAVALLGDKDNSLYFSVASLWEVETKGALDRADFRVDANLLRRGLVDNGYLELPIDGHHVRAVSTLPAIHRDPFDRVLVAQARREGLVLVTADRALDGYGSPVHLV